MNTVNIITTSISALACIAALVINPQKAGALAVNDNAVTRAVYTVYDKLHYVILLALVAAGAFLHFYKLTEIPAGIQGDEAAIAYDAWAILNYGVERYGYPYPVYFINWGDGMNALYIYLTALAYKIFGGYSLFAVRFTNALWGTAGVLVVYFFFRKIADKATGLIGAFIYTIMPVIIMMFRRGLEVYILYNCFALSLLILYCAIKKNSTQLYAFAGAAFGITLYCYAMTYMIIPAFLAVSVPLLLRAKRINIKQLFAFGIPIFIFALPLILLVLINHDVIPEIVTPYFSIPKLWLYKESDIALSNIRNVLTSMRSVFLSCRITYDAIAPYYTMYLMSLPLCAYGFILNVKGFVSEFKQKVYGAKTLMFAALCGALVPMLLVRDVVTYEMIGLYVPLTYLIATAVVDIYRKLKPAAYAVLVSFVVMTALFTDFYFNRFTEENHPLVFFQRNGVEAYSYAKQLYPDRPVCFTALWPDSCKSHAYIYALLANLDTPQYFQDTHYFVGETINYGDNTFGLPVRLKEDGSVVWDIYKDTVYVLNDDYATETTWAVFDKLVEEGFTVYEELPSYHIFYYEGEQ